MRPTTTPAVTASQGGAIRPTPYQASNPITKAAPPNHRVKAVVGLCAASHLRQRKPRGPRFLESVPAVTPATAPRKNVGYGQPPPSGVRDDLTHLDVLKRHSGRDG
jgi:hypothetical protein